MIVNPQVVSFLKAFQTIRHDGIQRALDRMGEFLGPFQEIFRQHGIPEDLAYLPIIESGFRVDATSRARANGAWQFMAATARIYGLRVDWQVDERLDPFKAADAAARFLKDLYEDYNDWYLALASYNGGPRRVTKAMRALQTSDFFAINQTRHIRRETKNYVPAFLASLIIARAPAEYGFTLDHGEAVFSGSQDGHRAVAGLAAADRLDAADLLRRVEETEPRAAARLHPQPPAGNTGCACRPRPTKPLLAGLERIPPSRSPSINSYRVRPGDSLYSIARRHGTSVGRSASANGLRSNLIRPGMNLIIPRGGG